MKNLPDKIYLNLGDISEEEYNELDFHDLFSEEVTWSDDDVQGRNVEYIRKDAFTKKACEGIEHLLSGYIIRNFHFGDSYGIDTLLEDFRKYMED